MSAAPHPLEHMTIADVKEVFNDNATLTQLFPEMNDRFDAFTEDDMSENLKMFLRPDERTRDRYAQLLEANPDGKVTMSEVLHMLTGKMPTPEYMRNIERLMEIVHYTDPEEDNNVNK